MSWYNWTGHYAFWNAAVNMSRTQCKLLYTTLEISVKTATTINTEKKQGFSKNLHLFSVISFQSIFLILNSYTFYELVEEFSVCT